LEGIFIKKYSSELKLAVIKYCIEEQHSYGEITKYFNLKDKKAVAKWEKHIMKKESLLFLKSNNRYRIKA